MPSRQLRQRQQVFSVAAVDLDHFKSINDQFSHAVGDSVLRRVGALLQSSVRAQDLAVGAGGEELVLILCGAERDAALSLCRWVVGELAGFDSSDLGAGLRVTASVGIASHLDALPWTRPMSWPWPTKGSISPRTLAETASSRARPSRPAGADTTEPPT